MGKIGMDVAKVRGVATSLTGQARRLDAVRTQVNRLVETAGREWKGANSDRFRREWNSQHQQALSELISKLDALSKTATQNADQQERASGSLGSGTAGTDEPSTGTQTSPTDGTQQAPADGTQTPANPDDPLSADVSGEAAVYKQGWEGSSDLGGGVTASGSASVTALGVSGAASAGITAAGASAQAQGKVTLVSAQAEGSVGTENASLSGNAKAEASAEGSAEASIGRDGLKASAGVSAFAGVSAGATAQANLGGVKPSVNAEVYAGIGAHANADVEVTASHVKASVDVGAAVGVGAGLKFDVDVDVDEVCNNLKGLFKW